MISLRERKQRWEQELARMPSGSRWGESRRFAGRSAGIRTERRQWLISHIAEAESKLRDGKSR
jgi:hypothetical protein